MAEGKPKDRWDKVDVVAGVVAKILIPVVIALATLSLNNNLRAREQAAQQAAQAREQAAQEATRERDRQLRTFEEAIDILQKDPKSTPETSALRAWAIEVFVRFTGKDIPAVRRELETKPLPRVTSGGAVFGGVEFGGAEFGDHGPPPSGGKR